MTQWREIDQEADGDDVAGPPSQPGWILSEREHTARRRRSPDRRRRLWSVIAFFGPAALVGIVLIVGRFFFGPTGNVPALDPVEKVNREVDGLPANARKAIQAFKPTEETDTEDFDNVDDPAVRARLVNHLSRNAETLSHLEKATAQPVCLFRLARDDRGLTELRDVRRFRDFVLSHQIWAKSSASRGMACAGPPETAYDPSESPARLIDTLPPC